MLKKEQLQVCEFMWNHLILIDFNIFRQPIILFPRNFKLFLHFFFLVDITRAVILYFLFFLHLKSYGEHLTRQDKEEHLISTVSVLISIRSLTTMAGLLLSLARTGQIRSKFKSLLHYPLSSERKISMFFYHIIP